jgi:hypothetical protein
MPGWAWAVIAVAVVVAVVLAAWTAFTARRTRHLRSRFGPEYDRAVEQRDGRREAEAELAARERRRSELDITPLDPAARRRYVERWQRVQAQFVDDPMGAVAEADVLIRSVMADRGYPVEDFDQRAADLSVDHPAVVEHYREGHRLGHGGAGGDATEERRQAMRHFRALFNDLVEDGADAPLTRAGDEAPAEHEIETRR